MGKFISLLLSGLALIFIYWLVRVKKCGKIKCPKCSNYYTYITRTSTGPDNSEPNLIHYTDRLKCMSCGEKTFLKSYTLGK